MSAPTLRKPSAQAILTVTRSERVSPNLIRITAGGPGFADYTDNIFTDRYVKILFAEPRFGLRPPYDLAALRAEAPEQLPARRTYTVRQSCPAEQWLAIDFVIHGDRGVAGPWAQSATVGDQLVLSGAGGKYAPDPEAPWHLVIADHTALPAVSSALEAMPATAQGEAIICVADPADRVLPRPPEGVRVTWVDTSDQLLARLTDLSWRAGDPQVFAHGERSMIKSARALLKERGVPRENLSISAYWAEGRAEDQFQAEKREPVGQLG